ncbi:protein kinase domain-containing protein [Novosphingobium terrae]|uniref:protein kinase domain-containing protein n=1 Tax=Novosphingobium terrae TaxID=2726189 RepID=UPI00198219D7|nr:protein kinase [Novosphingobium terrae]
MSEPFYDLSPEQRGQHLAFLAKAESAMDRSAGFSGEIVFLDNGRNVKPRLTCAKFPKWTQNLPPEERAKRFLREINLQASAHYHPNVHWPFDVIFTMGTPVAFFRRWEGDLSDFIEDENWKDDGRLALLVQLAAGLAHCHARGLVHQDLKPENIFVRDLAATIALPKAGFWLRPLVADFGSVNLAAEIGEHSGSRPYMAPEQWAKAGLSEKTSVFVLGIILHELMSCGIHPIGESSHDWHRHINPGFNRWQQNDFWRNWVAAGCPIAQPLDDHELAGLVQACLAVSPNDRPSLLYVQTELHRLLSQRSQAASDQVSVFLHMAATQSEEGEWQHLKQRVATLKRDIEAFYNL